MITNIVTVSKFETYCSHCGTKFDFDYEDIKETSEFLMNGKLFFKSNLISEETLEELEREKSRDDESSFGDYREYVVCPVCGYHHVVRQTYDRPHLDTVITSNVAIHWQDENDPVADSFTGIDKVFTWATDPYDLELTIRSSNSLNNCGIKKVEQLVKYTEEELLKKRNIGKKIIKEIKEKLSYFDLRLGMTDKDIFNYSQLQYLKRKERMNDNV